jgi:hypothetical protein
MNDNDVVATDVMKLIQLFSAQADLRFPDMNASVLHDAAVQVKERHLEVVRAEAMLLAARAALEEDIEALNKKAQRAHAYLRVFAENDEVLAARVDEISLPRPRRAVVRPDAATTALAPGELGAPPSPPRKRGRPRKVDVNATSLFAAEAAPAS